MKRAIRKFKETVEIRSSVVNRIRSHRYFPVGVLVCTCLVAACFHVWQRVKVLELVTKVSYLKAENASLVNDAKKIHSVISSFEMASRIERYARDTLGLEPISADRFIIVEQQKAEKPPPDKLATLAAAFKRAARYTPVVSQTSARAGGVRQLKIDSIANQGLDK